MPFKTDWSIVRAELCDAQLSLDPRDSTETCFFYLKLSELIDWIDTNPRCKKDA